MECLLSNGRCANLDLLFPIYNRDNVPGILYETVNPSVLYISYVSPGMLTDIRRIFKIFSIVIILFG